MKKKSKVTIGANLIQLRTNKKISLTELSQRSGIQLATLSRIENNKMTGTLESHMAIAEALGIHLEDLYNGVSPRNPSSTNPSPPALIETFTHNDQAYYEIMTNDIHLKKMLPLIVKIDGGGKTKTEAGIFGSEKFIYVLEGEVELVLGEQSFVIKRDTAFYFEASVNHHIKNVKTTSAKILSVRAPVKL
jgi:transcriptional regulator with XRE-family HTH domain